jgi:tight adherence protein C
VPLVAVALLVSVTSATLAWLLARHGFGRLKLFITGLCRRDAPDAITCGVSRSTRLVLRGARRLAQPLVPILASRLPAPWVAGAERDLRRAALDALVSPGEWCLLRLPVIVLTFASLSVLDAGWPAILGCAAFVLAFPSLWLRAVVQRREVAVLRELPFHLDMIALGLEAGGTLNAAVRASLQRAPPGPLREALQQFAAELQAGRGRIDSLEALQRRLDFESITPLISTLIQAERAGGSLASVLRIQAEQRAHERFHRAEKLAMQAPVKMLGPLVLCIFPCTFVVLGFVVWSSLRVGG